MRLDKRENLAEQVAAVIAARVLPELAAGERLPPLRVLAVELGVSVSTLQSAIAVLRHQGRVESRQGSGVYVAQAGRPRIGILSELDLLDARMSQGIRATTRLLKQRLEAADVDVTLYLGYADPGPGATDTPTCPLFWADVAAQRMDAAVIVNAPSSPVWFDRVQSCQVPAVGSWTGFAAELDSEGIVLAGVRHLIDRGCRRLGFLAWGLADCFAQTVRQCDAETSAKWIRTDLDPALHGAGWEEFREIWQDPAARPDGLLIMDDMLFADAQIAILELGIRVPEDLRLVVATNRGASPPIRLPVATLEMDPQEAADALAAMVLQRLADPTAEPARHRLSFRLCELEGTPSAPVAAPFIDVSTTRT